MPKRLEPYLAFLAAFLAILLIRWDAMNLLFYWDELGLYAPYAYTFFRNGIRFSTEWVTPILTHPPLFFWMIAGLAKIIGWGVPAFRIMTFLAGATYVSGTYVLARTRASRALSFLTALALFVAPVSLSEVALAQADLLAAAFSVWTLVALEKKAWKWATVLLALTALANATFLAIVPAYALGFYLLQSKKSALKNTFLFLTPVTVVSTIWFIYSWSFVQDDPAFVSGSIKYNSIFLQGSRALIFRFAHRVFQIGFVDGRWIFTFSIFASLYLAWKRKDSNFFDPLKWVIIAAIILETVFLTLFGVTHQRYFMVILSGFYVLGTWSLEYLTKQAVVPWKQLRWATPQRLMHTTLALTALYSFVTWHDIPNKYSALEYRSSYQDQIQIMMKVANELENLPQKALILTHWPLTHALKRPYLLFVKNQLNVMEFDYDFQSLDKNATALKQYPGPKIAVFLNEGGPTQNEVFTHLEKVTGVKLNSACKKYTQALSEIDVCNIW